ncbi:hypothetical protein L484_003802 [Morus notabilis]|uniref:Uncharacterized protein n=1 Tax=Morus notabilis TaxID=981085 RepID=W9RNP1_9ROSA|nr:hypothetical protein L484_003802 [Morus notabilis]
MRSCGGKDGLRIHIGELQTAHDEAEKTPTKRGFSTVVRIQPHHRQKRPFMEQNTTLRALNHRLIDLLKNPVQNDRH